MLPSAAAVVLPTPMLAREGSAAGCVCFGLRWFSGWDEVSIGFERRTMKSSDMLPVMRTDEGRSLVTLLAGRDADARTLYDAWMAAIVTQREKRERKEFSLTARQQQTIGRYEGDASSMMIDVIKQMEPEPDAAKLGFLLHAQIERVIAEEAFWVDLLSGPPKSAFGRLQKFRLATVEFLLAKNVVPWPPGAERRKELAALKEKYGVEVGRSQSSSGRRAT